MPSLTLRGQSGGAESESPRYSAALMAEGALFLGISHLFTGVVLVLVSIPLVRRRVKPNRWYGIRIPKAYASEANWYAINSVGGRWLARVGTAIALVGAYVLLRPPTTADGVMIAALAAVPLLPLTLVPVLLFARKLPS